MLKKFSLKLDSLFYLIATYLFGVGFVINLYELIVGSDFVVMRLLTEAILFVNYFFLLFLLLKKYPQSKFLAWLLITFLITLALEIIGVRTGLVFGQYTYGSTLLVQLFNVPVVIGVAWVVIVLGAVQIADKITDNLWLQLPLAGLLGLATDIILEPVAIKLGYWSWAGGPVPLQNYLAWFIITVVFAGLYKLLRLEIDSPPARYFLVLQAMFLLSVNLIFIFV
jgi:bisanhydrobacterioruberin hydratase